MDTYTDDARHAFAHTLSWLRQWACSRSFGLGTRLPWDPDFLVESLSDSTIYMAYYAVAHILQGGDMYGQKSDVPIPAPALSDAVFDAIFLDAPLPAAAGRRPPRPSHDASRADALLQRSLGPRPLAAQVGGAVSRLRGRPHGQ